MFMHLWRGFDAPVVWSRGTEFSTVSSQERWLGNQTTRLQNWNTIEKGIKEIYKEIKFDFFLNFIYNSLFNIIYMSIHQYIH